MNRQWRKTVKTTLIAAFSLMPLLPEIAKAAGIDTIPAVMATLAVVAATQRILAIPEIDQKINTWLGAPPPDTPDQSVTVTKQKDTNTHG